MRSPVILSGADGSRSQPSAKSKDPFQSRNAVGYAEGFCYPHTQTKTGKRQLATDH